MDLTGLNQGVSSAAFLEVEGENLFPYLLQLLEATYISWHLALSSKPKPGLLHLSDHSCVVIAPSVQNWERFSILKLHLIS